jgi:hypothetical protein
MQLFTVELLRISSSSWLSAHEAQNPDGVAMCAQQFIRLYVLSTKLLKEF